MRSLPLTEDKYMETIREQSVTAARQKQLASDIYKDQIPEELFLGEGYNNWRQQILVENKSKVLETIFSRGYFASGHYDTTARLFSKASFPITDSFFSRTVNLFNDKYVDENSMIAVAKIIKQHALRSSRRH